MPINMNISGLKTDSCKKRSKSIYRLREKQKKLLIYLFPVSEDVFIIVIESELVLLLAV